MQKEDSYPVGSESGARMNSNDVDNSSTPPIPTYHQLPSYHEQTSVKPDGSRSSMADYMLNDPPNMNVDRTLSFADVMHFADFGPKLGLNHNHNHNHPQQHDRPPETSNNTNFTDDEHVYFLKFPVLSNSHITTSIQDVGNQDRAAFGDPLEEIRGREYSGYNQEDVVLSNNNNNMSNYSNPVQLEFLSNTHDDDSLMGLRGDEKIGAINMDGVAEGTVGGNNKSSNNSNSKRKRPRTIKTNEEVESQRMTHIAVERNRRKQMNEHLRVLRSLMPSSYVQRGDQASIIGGAIEFVRELEQLLQCLESQKRRRLYGDQAARAPLGDSNTSSSTMIGLVQQTPPQVQPGNMGFPPPTMAAAYQDDDQLLDPTSSAGGGLLQEESAESKSCIADVEVKVLGFDALIKILSRRRPGQLIKAIAALEDLHFTILHTNITTIEQTVLYSFNVKVANEARFNAEDIATSVQQIFTFIHTNTNIL